MTPHWITHDLAERLIGAGWDGSLGDPGLLQPVDRGFGSDVYAIAGSVVVRVARSLSAQHGHRREAALLPLLVGRLPAQVPGVVWYAPSSPGLPYGAVALSWLDGETPVGPEEAPPSSDMVEFLVALHGIDPEALASAALADRQAVDRRRRADAKIAIDVASRRWTPARSTPSPAGSTAPSAR
ncbi:MAG TPA: aminoglycoside phosphotransferase family protein [Acidimicrobiales bacterium]|nr:aminoglycoside phosphotransferase family protein [Acidimicrobiales bacterium]